MSACFRVTNVIKLVVSRMRSEHVSIAQYRGSSWVLALVKKFVAEVQRGRGPFSRVFTLPKLSDHGLAGFLSLLIQLLLLNYESRVLSPHRYCTPPLLSATLSTERGITFRLASAEYSILPKLDLDSHGILSTVNRPHLRRINEQVVWMEVHMFSTLLAANMLIEDSDHKSALSGYALKINIRCTTTAET